MPVCSNIETVQTRNLPRRDAGHNRMLFLVDPQLPRRNVICRSLTERQVYVEPFESLDELASYFPRGGILMIDDQPGQLLKLSNLMSKCARWLPVIAFSESPNSRRVARAIREGATTYVAWPCNVDELIETIAEAHEQIGALATLRIRITQARSRLDTLTRRERQVLEAITDGLSNREIGERLTISARTVEIHRANMLGKIGANHTSQAIKIAIEASLI